MPDLVLGPVVRHLGTTHATVWAETDSPCTVEILGHRVRTFTAAGHHYALVAVEGLSPGTSTPYQVRLDGELRWPPPAGRFPESLLRTPGPSGVRLVAGSCRVAHPHRPPYTFPPERSPEGHGPDALEALALGMAGRPVEEWPHLLLHIGDQVYADELPPATAEMVRRRDRRDWPRDQVVDLEEFRSLYVEAWSRPAIRWLLSTVGNLMIFDDHDVHDDWNTSAAWLAEMRAQPWWQERISAALASYWLYQHAGNLDPAEMRTDPLFVTVTAAPGDATAALREFARQAAEQPHRVRWSHAHDLPHARVLVVDSRAGRVLDPGCRAMLDGDEEGWLRDRLRGDVDHLLVASSLPVLLPRALHHVEAWSERVAGGAWGAAAARLGERLRQGLDLEHWAAFQASFRRMTAGVAEVAAGARGAPPASVVWLGGDVHFGYIAQARWSGAPAPGACVHQVVSSPMRNPLLPRLRRAARVALIPGLAAVAAAVARSAGAGDPGLRWRIVDGPWFDNQVVTIDVEERRLAVRVERAVLDGQEPRLEVLAERRLA